MQWIKSYLSNRQQAVIIRGVQSNPRALKIGVPQGSVLGPELFKDYVAPLSALIEQFGVMFHGYADDTQLANTFKPGGEDEKRALNEMQSCIKAIKSWMALNSLKINDDKTEFMIIGSKANLKKVKTNHIIVGTHKIAVSSSVRNIGAVFDSEMTMIPQVLKTAQTAWFHLREISKIRIHLTQKQTQSVIHAYVTSRIDQNNSLINGIPAEYLNILQKVQNAAAKIILGGKKYDHVTPLLKQLHWLPLPQRYRFKTLLIVYKTLQGDGPSYLHDLLKPLQLERFTRSSLNNLLEVTRTRVEYGDRAFSVAGPRL